MTEPTLVDNDIVIKLCCFGCHRLLATAIGVPPAGMLSIGRFTLRDRIKRANNVVHRDQVSAALEEVFVSLEMLQPSEDELMLAAEFEEQAARRSVSLDIGESQLLAILICRGGSLLLTGDKRAIIAIHELGVSGVTGRLACLEQVLHTMVTLHGADVLRAKVCAEPNVDRAATACCACSSTECSEIDIRAGLSSYIKHLRRASGAVLFEADELPVSS